MYRQIYHGKVLPFKILNTQHYRICPTRRRKHYAVYIEIVSSQKSRQKELVKENGELTDVIEQPAPWGCDDGSGDDFDMHE